MNCARSSAYYMLCAAMLVCPSLGLLSGCATIKPEPVVVVQKEYVVRIPPANLITLPPPVPKMELNDQGDVSKWIVLEMERMSLLENQITNIAKFLKDTETK